MKKFILIFLIFTFPLKAEIVTEIGKHKHLGNYTKEQSCKIAREKAEKNALIKSLGQTISSETVTNCSEVDGEYDCERNQLSLFKLNGIITSSQIINKNYDKEVGSEILYCEITIRAKVEPIKRKSDPTFHFDTKLNKKIFRSGENLEIEINTSKKMYMTIFQWLPYGGKKYNIITKIFPNEKFNKNINNLIEGNLKLKYETYFPDKIKYEKVDEHLIFVASEEKIPWLEEYADRSSLAKRLNQQNLLMEVETNSYIIIK
jgi:hypothetical protein